jgi:hypothetical protein
MLNRLLLVLDLLLVVGAGALGVHLYRIWTAAPTATASAPPSPAAPVRIADAAPTLGPSPSPSALGIVVERNLFSPTRAEVVPEPPKPVTAGAMPAARPAEKPRLYGVVLGADGGARAYLWDPQSKKVFGYKVGDSLADTRVEQINADRVVLRRSGETFEVLLRDPSKPKPVAAPVPAAAPGVPQFPGAVPSPGAQPQAPGQPGTEGQTVVPGQLPFGVPGTVAPVVPQRPGTPSVFPLRPPIRVAPGVPARRVPSPQPQSSGDAGS